jgi:tRNA A-37 threonylcarbamoyl transferase component Bud32
MTAEQGDRSATDRRIGDVVFADEDARALLAGHLEELFHPTAAAWRQVKHNTSRTVYRGTIGGREVYLKHFHSRSIFHRFMRRLGSSDAMRELRFSQHLQRHGVPTARVLAAACRGGVEWLATEAVVAASPADAWHEEQLRRGADGQRAIRQAAAQLGRLIGRMHAAGVIHSDLHCGNILVRTSGNGDGRGSEGGKLDLVLMDLHRAQRRKNLTRRARSANLAMLFHDRFHLTHRTDRLRFLHQYLQASQASGSLRGWQELVEQFAALHRRRLHAQRDRRTFKPGKYFACLRLPGRWSGHVVLESKRRMAGSTAAECVLTTADWQQCLADPPGLLSGPEVQVVKDSPSSRVVRRKLQVGPHLLDVFIKQPRRKRRWKWLLDCFRAARPIRSFALGHALLTRRIATALPLAALERRVGPVLLDSLLITEAVHAPLLDEFMATQLANPPRAGTQVTVVQQRQLAQDVLWQLGRLLQRLHDNRFAHRDLKATNLLVHWQAGSSPQIVLLDLDGLTQCRVLTARRRFQGLMRLNVSLLKCPAVNRAGRLRMLLGYLRRLGEGRVEFKPYWRMLEVWSAKKLRQQIRSRRRRQKAVRRPGT